MYTSQLLFSVAGKFFSNNEEIFFRNGEGKKCNSILVGSNIINFFKSGSCFFSTVELFNESGVGNSSCYMDNYNCLLSLHK